jgi:hypothetical protein
MSPNPQAFVQHLREAGYHPRSNKHSNALAECLVTDLLAGCPAAAQAAAEGRLVYGLNFTIRTGTSDWNVDLVLGAPPPGTAPPGDGTAVRQTAPSTVQIAIEIKSVMTEHQKAIRNRKRDLEAHHDHVHRYSNRTIAGGVLVLNCSETFDSPLRSGVTTHQNPRRLLERCMHQARSISSRANLNGQGLDAKCTIVVDMDNQDLASTRYVTATPAPTVGDPLHYDAFIQALCALYNERFPAA